MAKVVNAPDVTKEEALEHRRRRWVALRTIAESYGLNQNRWAEKSGRPQETLSNFYAKGAIPNEETMADLCAGLGLPRTISRDLGVIKAIANLAQHYRSCLQTVEFFRERLDQAAEIYDQGAFVVEDEAKRRRVLKELGRVLDPTAKILLLLMKQLADVIELKGTLPESADLSRMEETLAQFRSDVLTLWRILFEVAQPSEKEEFKDDLYYRLGRVIALADTELQRLVGMSKVVTPSHILVLNALFNQYLDELLGAIGGEMTH